MLDTSHPRTKIIFEAARYLDILKLIGRQVVQEPADVRVELFQKADQTCEQLAGFAGRHYPQKLPWIADLLTRLKSEWQELAKRESSAAEGYCQLCNAELTVVSTGLQDKSVIVYCAGCMAEVWQLLEELEDPLETKWI